jgi:murein DD-endopeptidase MepM/ murein hydrolase activator NlpD
MLKFSLLSSLFSLSSLSLSAQLNNQAIRDLKGGRVENDTSYVYWLPYQNKKSFLLIQGWQSNMSHKNELSLDFKMKPGTKVCAAREGVVTSTKEDSDRGGMKAEYMGDGNHVVIRHVDGTYAAYWHLQKDGVIVNVGDNVYKGQAIGYSGNTGYSAFPHLHFEVYTSSMGYSTIPTRFLTRKGIRYLRPGKFYRSIQRFTVNCDAVEKL